LLLSLLSAKGLFTQISSLPSKAKKKKKKRKSYQLKLETTHSLESAAFSLTAK
jgi:hypothetical protein